MTRLLIGVGAIALAALFVYSGIFDVAADAPHSALVYAVIEAIRDRSIAVRAKNIRVPSLNNPEQIADGAKHYDAMCADCHLAPGGQQPEMRAGLYPQPPRLTERIDLGVAETFWVVKHGIKMSAMPAWGTTHDDQSLWAIVAFLQKLPELTPDEYRTLVQPNAESPHHDHAHSHHHHGAGEHRE